MELNKEYAKNVPEDFFNGFIKEISKYPLGGMSKRDLDCLIFYLLKECKLIPGEMNRDKAYNLKISESKYKSYLVDSDAKFVEKREESDMEANVQQMFDHLANGDKNVSLEGDTLVFIEENSIVKDDFAYAMKKAGFYTDTSFNSEIIKVKAAGFLAFARSKGQLDDKKILEFLNKDKSDKEVLDDFFNEMKTPKEIMQDVFGILKSQENFGIKTIAELFGYAADVAKSKMR